MKNLVLFALTLPSVIICCSCDGGDPGDKEWVEVERIGEISGELEVVRPDGTLYRQKKSEDIVFFLPGTKFTVLEGECIAYLGGTRIKLSSGHSARVIPPLTRVDSILIRTGSFRAVLPDGGEVLVLEEAELPQLPAQSLLLVIDGEISVFVKGSRVSLPEGEVAILARPIGIPVQVVEPSLTPPLALSSDKETDRLKDLVRPSPALGPASPYLP